MQTNKITLIGIVSKKNSILFRASDIKLFIPEVKEAGLGIVPTSSTCEQLAIGDCLAVAALNKKGFSRKKIPSCRCLIPTNLYRGNEDKLVR